MTEDNIYLSPSALVRQFHETFGAPIASTDNPSVDLPFDRTHLRFNLIAEEFVELTEAIYGKPTADAIDYEIKWLTKEAILETQTDPDFPEYLTTELPLNTVEVADALADMVYVIYGFALEAGIDLDAVLLEVQRSNLSKLGEDRKPILREDGKVLKGPNFFQPDIRKVLFPNEV